MAKRRTRLFISVFACAMLFMYGALNCAYADDSSDDANSWRFFHGENIVYAVARHRYGVACFFDGTD